MKKIFAIATVSTLLFSCGGGPSTPCDCAQGLKDMTAAFEQAEGDDAKQESLKKEFEQLNTDCEALREKMGGDKFQEEIEKCLEEME